MTTATKAHAAKIRRKLAKACGTEPFIISAATGDGVEELLEALFAMIGQSAVTEAEEVEPEAAWSPLA